MSTTDGWGGKGALARRRCVVSSDTSVASTVQGVAYPTRTAARRNEAIIAIRPCGRGVPASSAHTAVPAAILRPTNDDAQ